MAGVRDELILDISQAQRSIDALERQITSAFSSLSVDVDTAGISQEITRAVEAADTSTLVTVDTAGITSEITAAVDRADTDVLVNADTAAARREVQKLDADIDEASRSASGLGGILTGAALLAGARGLLGLAEASSAVKEQVTGSEIVFGNLAGEIQRFADQADRIGLGQAQALQLSNTFGQLALSAGLSEQAVADFATTIVQRGADIASLRDIDLSDTLAALRAGLVGETEPLRNIGIFINEASVATEAYRLGLADLGDELTDQQKIQARYSLILQQSEIAAGNFALTSEGLANKQRQVTASFKDLAADAGGILEPTFLNLFNIAEQQLIPSLAKLGEEALPAIGQILEDLAPVLGITIDLLIAGAPILQLIADVISIIPAPLIAAAGGWLAFQKAQDLATGTAALARVDRMATGLGTLARSLFIPGGRLGIGGALGLTAAVGGLIAITTTEAGSDIGAMAGQVLQLADSLTGFGARREESITGELEALIGGLDTSKLNESQIAIGKLTGELDLLDDRLGKGRLFSLGDVNIFGTTGDANRQERIDQIREQIDALNEQATAEVRAGIDTGRFTDAQLAATAAQADREGAISPIVRQLELLRQVEERAARNAAVVIDKYKDVAAQYIETGDAAGRLRDAAPEVERAVTAIRLSGQGGDLAFLNLASALSEADLSAEGMQDTAALLGTDVGRLTGFVEKTTTALQDFIDTAVGGLPTVSDAFDAALTDSETAAASAAQSITDSASDRAQAVLDAARAQVDAAGDTLAKADADRILAAAETRADAIREGADVEAEAIKDGAVITARGLTAALEAQADALAGFRSDLDQIAAAGFVDLAGLIAGQGLETGNAIANELAAALDAGNVEILEGLRTANQQFETESLATVDFITNELGPQVLSASGLLASAISESFGENLDFEEKVRIAAGLAGSELDSQGKQIAAIAAVEGERAAREYGAALKLDQAVIDAGVAAGLALTDASPIDEAGTAGGLTGFAFIDGMVAAFNDANKRRELENAVRATGQAAINIANEKLGIRSPSTVAYQMGAFFIEGLTLGLDNSSSAVAASARAASRVVDGLASQVPQFGVRTPSPAVTTTAQGRLHPEDIAALAAAVGRPNFSATVHNPIGRTSEQSLTREMESFFNLMFGGN